MGTIFDVTVNGNVTASDHYIGGLVGSNSGQIIGANVNVNVNGSNYVGGVAGINYFQIRQSKYNGNITTGNMGGGMAGGLWSGQIINTFSSGSCAGFRCGGIAGLVLNGPTISNSFSNMAISIGGTIGGLVADNTVSGNSNITNSYWDTTASGLATSDGGEGKTTLELQNISTYSSWDFINIWDIDGITNNGYPFLRSFSAPQVPTYEIANITHNSFSTTITNTGSNLPITSYRLDYREEGSINWTTLTSINGNIYVNDLNGSTNYDVRFATANMEGWSSFTAIDTVTTLQTPQPPDAPTGLNINFLDEGNPFNVEATWIPPASWGTSEADYYVLRYRLEGSDWGIIVGSEIIDGELTSYQFNLPYNYNVSYEFSISASNTNYLESEYSEIANYSIGESPVILISNCEELQNIDNLIDSNPINASKKYILQNNIDCTETQIWNSTGEPDEYYGFNPIDYFSGEFDGNSKTIFGLYINASNSNGAALFEDLRGAYIHNLNMDNINIRSIYGKAASIAAVTSLTTSIIDNVNVTNAIINGYNENEEGAVGGLIATSQDRLEILDSSFDGQVDGVYRVGGLIGLVDSNTSIENSYNKGNISGIYRVGGLIGSGFNISINNSYNLGSINAQIPNSLGFPHFQGVGGLIGVGEVVEISNSANLGEVNGIGTLYVGGLVGGGFEITINGSYNKGNILWELPDLEINPLEQYESIGGLIGTSYSLYISDSYNSGNVKGWLRGGGLAGWTISAQISNSYNSGNIDIDYLEDNDIVQGAGGIVGVNYYVWPFGSPDLSINGSFNVGSVNTNSSSISGNFIGSIDLENSSSVVGYNNYYKSNIEECIGNLFEIEFECSEKVDNGLFMNNTTEDPLNNWDFDDLWLTKVNDYPILKQAPYPIIDIENPVDNIAPVINLNGGSTIFVLKGNQYIEQGATATDNIDGNITNSITILGNINTNQIGTYIITYSVKDSSNNSSSITRRVIVFELSNDTIQSPVRIILNDFKEYSNNPGKNLELRINDVIYFKLFKEGIENNHSITIINIEKDIVTVVFRSTPKEVSFRVGEVKVIDVDDDFANDIQVSLLEIKDGSASFNFKQLQTGPVSYISVNKEDPVSLPIDSSLKSKEELTNNEWSILIICLVALIPLVISAFLIKQRNNENNSK